MSSVTCVACKSNAFSLAGSTSPAHCHCNAGYWGIAGGTTCAACRQYAHSLPQSTAAGDCLCNAGYTLESGDTLQCPPCVAGKYKAGVGNGECDLCPAQTYSSTPAAATPTVCANSPAFTVSNDERTSYVCDRGATGPDHATCTQCLAGSYKSETGNAPCTPCGADTYSAIVGATFDTCNTCVPGKTRVAGASLSCEVCPAGTYTAHSGAPQCVPCPENTGSAAGATECVCAGGDELGCHDVLHVVVYVPSTSELAVLDLSVAVSGDDVEEASWQRLHVTVAMEWDQPQTCSSEIGMAAVSNQGIVLHQHNSQLHRLGCTLRAAGDTYAVCHLSIPTALQINSLVAVSAVHGTTPCSAPSHFTVILEPLTSLQLCDGNELWDFRLEQCVTCDVSDAVFVCAPGHYVPGCNALSHIEEGVSPCVQCPVDVHDESEVWEAGSGCVRACRDGYFRTGGVCALCSVDVGVCGVGERTAACTRAHDRMCVPCDAVSKGTYSQNEDFVLEAGRECATQCKSTFYRLPDTQEPCVPCSAREQLVAVWEGEQRPAGSFASFVACGVQTDASSVPCAGVADGTVTGHAPGFGEPCPYECALGFHDVSPGCVHCAEKRDQFNAALPPAVYSVTSRDCVVACLLPYHAYDDTCWRCEPGLCPTGQYLSECRDCVPCVPLHVNRHYSSSGIWRNDSCETQCNEGFWDDFGLCSPHSLYDTVRGFCLTGSDYIVSGTHMYDTTCMPCRSCEGLRETQSCTLAHDRICEPCPPRQLDKYVGSDCTASCISGRVHNVATGSCESCAHVCTPGTNFTSDRQHCSDCRPCDESLLAQGTRAWLVGCDSVLVDAVRFSQGLIAVAEQYLQECTHATTYDTESRTCVECQLREDPTRPPVVDYPGTWTWVAGSRSCEWQCMPTFSRFRGSGQTRLLCVSWSSVMAHFSSETGVVTGSLATKFLPISHKKEVINRNEVIFFGVLVLLTMLVMLFR